MKKTIIAAVAAAVLGSATLAVTPTPASAYFWLPMVLEMKKDKNFKAANVAPAKKMKAKKKK
jgi:hypothetical protein